MTTGEIVRMPRNNGSFRFRIAVAGAITTAEKSLPVNPYLMGYWLGNGNATAPVITVHTCELCGKTDSKQYEIHHVKRLKDLKGNQIGNVP